MTFSLIATNTDRTLLGVVTTTRTVAVGAFVTAAIPRVGAVATQAYTNRAFRHRVPNLLRAGLTPAETVHTLHGEDDRFAWRQVGIVSATGESATWTGPECTPWAGGMSGDGWAAVGNYLTGSDVLHAMVDVFHTGNGGTFDRILVDALTAGQARGGDRRGRQSAALLVVSNLADAASPPETVTDLRVDDHDDPVRELSRLLDVWNVEQGR